MPQMQPALLRRFGERGRYELADAQAVFADAFIAHVAYVDDGMPACQPMLALIREEGGEEEGTEGENNAFVYLHGHPTTRLMELVKQADKAGEAAEPVPPVKVCITATKVDGLVLSTAPNGHSFNYRSAMIHGTCYPLRDHAAKRDIMLAVTNAIVPGRVAEVNPISSRVVSMVYVVRVAIDRLSVKARTGPPGIQPRQTDVDGPDIDDPPAWAGVVPLWEHLGEPVALSSGQTPTAQVPDSLRAYISTRNTQHEGYAKRVAR